MGSFLFLLSFNFIKLFDLLARIPFKSGMLSMCFRKRLIKMIKNNNLVLKDECSFSNKTPPTPWSPQAGISGWTRCCSGT